MSKFNKMELENGSTIERRIGERRRGERRNPDRDEYYNGEERRVNTTDRRITIVNRLKSEVTDRRSLD